MNAFEQWWWDEGSGMPAKEGEEACFHVERVSKIAWQNGDFKAREEFHRIAIECNCRAQHGADGAEHLLAIEKMIQELINKKAEYGQP